MSLIHRPAAITAVLSLALVLLYLAFPTKAYYWDGIVFAQAIEDASSLNASLAHPNHLAYNFFGYIFYRLLRTIGFDIRALTVLQILNSILAAACAALLFAILRNALRSLYLAVCMTLLFALSATWWKFATDANAYIPSVFFLLLSFYLVLPDRKPAPTLLAVTFFAAMCFHQLAVIACPVFALGVYLQDGSLSLKRRVQNAAVFSIVAFVLIVATYATVFYWATGTFTLSRFWHWTLSYSPDADTRFSFWSNLGYSLRGQVRLFFGGRFNLLNGLKSYLIWSLLFVWFATVTAFIIAIVRSLSPALKQRLLERSLRPPQQTVLLLALVWAAAYLVFLFFWLPQNTFYRLFYLPALILLLGLALASIQPHGFRRTYATALFVVALGLANFLFLIYPFSHVEKYPPLALALQMNREWPPGTVVYYAAQNSDGALVRYFTPGTQWKQLPDQLPDEINGWLETTAIDRIIATDAGPGWLHVHTVSESIRELNNGAYRMRFVKVVPRDQK
jgi:hypothetical protein